MNAITWQDVLECAKELGVEAHALEAVRQVESAGSGFLADGRPKILFEGHIFWKELKKRGLNPAEYAAANPDIVYSKWTKQFYKNGAGEYDRLNRATAIHEEAALCSASWGAFQIMGFNHQVCGYATVREFVEAMRRSEAEHLRAVCGFIKGNNLDKALRDKRWDSFAKGYNGPGYAENRYDIKLREAYDKSRAEHA